MIASCIRRIALLSLALILSGCPGLYGDYAYGISRSAVIDTMPSLDCVRDAIKSTPGIATVEFQQSAGGRPLTWSELQAPNEVLTSLYSGSAGSDVGGAVQITKNHRGEVQFEETKLSLGGPFPQEVLAANRVVMQGIEANIAARCDLARLPAQVRESCVNMECKG